MRSLSTTLSLHAACEEPDAKERDHEHAGTGHVILRLEDEWVSQGEERDKGNKAADDGDNDAGVEHTVGVDADGDGGGACA